MERYNDLFVKASLFMTTDREGRMHDRAEEKAFRDTGGDRKRMGDRRVRGYLKKSGDTLLFFVGGSGYNV